MSHGLRCIRKSHLFLNGEVEQKSGEAQVIILDTRGELSSIYSLGWIAFVGGTLSPVGGHNLLEPARWGVPVFFGPYTDHCAEIAQLLREAGGGIEVQNEHELFEQISYAYHHDSWTQGIGHAAREVLQAHRGVVGKNIEYIASEIDAYHKVSSNTSTSPTSTSTL